MEAVGQLDIGKLACDLVRAVSLDEQALAREHSNDLDSEERDALRPLEDPLGDATGRPGISPTRSPCIASSASGSRWRDVKVRWPAPQFGRRS